MYLHPSSLELTFAGLRALEPPVVNISIASTSAVLIPSAARSATTGCAGFLRDAAFGAHNTDSRRRDSYMRALVKDTTRHKEGNL